MTGNTWLNLYTAKILGFTDLEDRFAEVLRSEQRTALADLWGPGGTLSAKVPAGAGGVTFPLTGRLSIGGTHGGYNGSGYRLEMDGTDPEYLNVPFEDTGATTYHLGLKHAGDDTVPGAAELGKDGSINWSYYNDAIGEVVTPDSVIDNGDGTLTLVLAASGVHADWGTDTSTRPVTVWKLVPVTSGAEALYEGTAAYDAGDTRIEVTTTHDFGQATPSTTAADYRVLVKGPTVTETDISSDADYWYLGTILGGSPSTFDATNQLLITDIGTLGGDFYVQHKTGGTHGSVTADEYAYNGDQNDAIIAHYGADDLKAWEATMEVLTGAPALGYTPYDEGVSHPEVFLTTAITGEARIYIPLDIGDDVTITHYAFRASRNGGTAEVEARIVRQAPGSTAARTVEGTIAFGDTSGSYVDQPKTALGGTIAIARSPDYRLMLEIRLKNDGTTAGTARFEKLTLYGKYTKAKAAGTRSYQP